MSAPRSQRVRTTSRAPSGPRVEQFLLAEAARQHTEQLERACQPELTRCHITRNEAERVERSWPVGRFQIGLDAVIVRAEEHRKSRRIARASKVFHQQRIEQR